MDAQQFGAFIQQRRKELGMKQSDLAEKLHVTNKAISRWERAVGFPDIKLLEPLAEALEVSLTELLQCRMLPKEDLPQLQQQTEELLQEQTRLSWKRRLVLWLGSVAILLAGVVDHPHTRPGLECEAAVSGYRPDHCCSAILYGTRRRDPGMGNIRKQTGTTKNVVPVIFC